MGQTILSANRPLRTRLRRAAGLTESGATFLAGCAEKPLRGALCGCRTALRQHGVLLDAGDDVGFVAFGGVGTGAAEQGVVVAVEGEEVVVAALAEEHAAAVGHVEAVAAGAAVEVVDAEAAVKLVGAGGSVKLIVSA